MFSFQFWGYFNRRNLLFTDSIQTLVDVGEKNIYYSWVGELKILGIQFFIYIRLLYVYQYMFFIFKFVKVIF